MAYSQRAWDDVLAIMANVSSLDNEIVSMLKVNLLALKERFDAVVADPARLQEDVALADTHPVFNSTKLTGDVGKFLALHEWLQANGYYS